jgi:RNA polymerase subunit RPABC4/transcription elongation factor Spt4
MEEHHHTAYCERCGVELLPADPEPLCAMCYVSDTSVYAPSLLLVTDASWSGGTPHRPAAPHRKPGSFVPWRPDPDGKDAAKRTRRSRRITVVLALLTLAALMFAVVPAAISGTKPGPVHIGVQRVDAGTDACLANLYILVADKVAGRASPADIVCPVCGKPYLYSQYQGVTTITCPDAAAHHQTRIYVKTDTGVPIVN